MLHWPYYPPLNIYASCISSLSYREDFFHVKWRKADFPHELTKAVWFKVSKHPSTDLWTCLTHTGCSCSCGADSLLPCNWRPSLLTNPSMYDPTLMISPTKQQWGNRRLIKALWRMNQDNPETVCQAHTTFILSVSGCNTCCHINVLIWIIKHYVITFTVIQCNADFWGTWIGFCWSISNSCPWSFDIPVPFQLLWFFPTDCRLALSIDWEWLRPKFSR